MKNARMSQKRGQLTAGTGRHFRDGLSDEGQWTAGDVSGSRGARGGGGLRQPGCSGQVPADESHYRS